MMSRKIEELRLFARTCVSWETKTRDSAHEKIDKFVRENIHHETQKCNIKIEETTRKLRPFDVEISFYSLDTLRQISEYYKEFENDGIYRI